MTLMFSEIEVIIDYIKNKKTILQEKNGFKIKFYYLIKPTW